MDIEAFREYCLNKKGVTEELPFGPDTLVFKVMGKVFALASMTFTPFRANLKMDENLVPEYREKYEDVQPGYHQNKRHWNTVYLDSGAIPNKQIAWMIDHSYQEVVKGLTNKLKNELKLL
jgi:predicted DNA-binding protein (MmcQ/YjbR family)